MHLRYLIHFVGDIQQFLHCLTAVSFSSLGGDAGGNGFSLTGGWFNLYSLWDGGGGYLFDSVSWLLSTDAQNTLNAKVAAIEANHPYNYATNRSVSNPMDWAQEGLAMAQNICYVG